MNVRAERAGDERAIRRVLAAAFPSAAEADLVEALRADGDLVVARVALDASGEPIGFVAFSPVTTAHGESGLGLAPLAVEPREQRRGIGALLVRDGLRACAELGCAFVVVLGDPAYYGRFGFTPAARFGSSDEYGGGDAFQVLELRAGALPRGAGLVRYTPAFAPFAS